jgi:hypothetical protein
MIIALAGRRIDAPDAEADRFPLRNVGPVRDRLRALFESYPGETLVCSAACGADLLALDTAGNLGWRRRVILPFGRERFRETSVTDRPGDWSALYERILGEVEPVGDLVIAASPPGRDAYEFASDRILEEAEQLAAGSGEKEVAVVVWDGRPRGPHDITQNFLAAATKRGLTVVQVSTLD